MNLAFRIGCVVLAVSFAAGCTSTTTVTRSEADAGTRRLRKPDRILVYNFVSTADDLPMEERGDGYAEPTTPPSSEFVRAGRQIGAAVAAQLVADINAMGLYAEVGNSSDAPRIGDVVIDGHFESIDEGSAAKRVAIGFGSGRAELQTVVVGYQMTKQGLKRVGAATVDAGGGKGPGLFIPVVVTAATANPIGLVVVGAVKAEGEISGRTTLEGAIRKTSGAIAQRLQERFQREGWI